MNLAKRLLTGALIMSTQFAMAAEPISQQMVLEKVLEVRYPKYYSLRYQAMGIEDQIKDTWRLQAKNPGSKDYYTGQRQSLRRMLVGVEEHSSRLKKQAIHDLENKNVQEYFIQGIQDQRESARFEALDAEEARKRASDAWLKQQKPNTDAHYAKVDALKANSDINNNSFFLIDESKKGTKKFITEISLSAAEKAQVVKAQTEFGELMETMKGSHLESTYARMKVLAGGQLGDLDTVEKFKAAITKMKELSSGLDTASSKEQLLLRAGELSELVKPQTLVLSNYKAQNYRILFGMKDPIIQRERHLVILDNSGKVKGILQNGTTLLKGKANIKRTLVSLGLSTLAISSLADEVVKVEDATPAAGRPFQSKNWASQGAR